MGNTTGERRFSRWAVPLLWLTVFFSVLFAALIFVIPLDEYRLLGHIFEATVALFCMACCLYLYRSVSDRLLLLLAAFAFFSYALSTTFWYLYTVALGRMFVFTTVAEFGFLCFFFFFIAAISIEAEGGQWVLRASAKLQARFEQLLQRRKAGALDEAESREYEAICDLDTALSWLNRLARSAQGV